MKDIDKPKMFQLKVIYYDVNGKVMKTELQEVPIDNKFHWSKVVEE